MSQSLPYFWLLKIYPSFSLSPYLRMLRAAWHGRRHNLQPADNGLIYPPCALWLAKVVPVLCTPQQEGPGQRLDRCRKWQMAVDSGKTPSQYREHAKPGQGQGQMDQGTDAQHSAQKVLRFVVYVCLNLICVCWESLACSACRGRCFIRFIIGLDHWYGKTGGLIARSEERHSGCRCSLMCQTMWKANGRCQPGAASSHLMMLTLTQLCRLLLWLFCLCNRVGDCARKPTS